MTDVDIEIVPAILRRTYEDIATDWQKMYTAARHIQIDITDGVFAGDGTFREVTRFRQLPLYDKIELHVMVHTPTTFLTDILTLQPARCIFHLESFTGTDDLVGMYQTLRERTQTELALALNPETPSERLGEYLPLLHFVLFMGYNPGWANQPLNETVFNKVANWKTRHSDIPIAVDGHVNKKTISRYVASGATRLAANTAIFGAGDPVENLRQLQLLADACLPAGRPAT